MSTQETRLKRNHIALMKHPETAWYSGIMMMGSSSVSDEKFTAYTDGVNKRYSREYMEGIKDDAKLRGLIMHENLHVALKHIPRHMDLWKLDSRLANMAADFVVNDIIMNMKDTKHIQLPDGGLYDAKYHNWSVREVFEDLRKQQKQGGGGGGSGSDEGQGSLDEHGWEDAKDMTAEEIKELEGKLDRALREGGILAGRMGANIPRSISDLLAPKVDWREVLREFVSSATRGSDEYTWRKFNKRMLANDMYMPSLENETIGEVVVAIDTSGSITGEQITEFASELASICETCSPDKVRVLWWDTIVHGEQVFDKDFSNIAGVLKPLGGGGTMVSCVSEYIVKESINAECVLVFTDGYVESDIKWEISSPTLWMVTQNDSFEPPTGKVVSTKDR